MSCLENVTILWRRISEQIQQLSLSATVIVVYTYDTGIRP